MASIFLSVPVHERPEMACMMALFKAMTTTSHKVVFQQLEGDSLISRARNVHISVFLESKCDWFCSIDSDLDIVNCFRGDNFFDRLVAHDVEFCGGLYALKDSRKRAMSSVAWSGDPLPKFNSGLVRMRWLSTGMWCLRRDGVEKMCRSYPELEYDADVHTPGKKCWGFYIPLLAEYGHKDFSNIPEGKTFKKYLSEDWGYCHRWSAIGGEIWADTGIVLKHIGKFPYALYDVEVQETKRE